MSPDDRIVDLVIHQLSVALDIPEIEIAPDSALMRLRNADSLGLLSAVTSIEAELQIDIDPDQLVLVRTVGELVQLIQDNPA